MSTSTTQADRGTWFQQGALGGLVGGIVMAMVAMMYTLVAQGDLLAPLKQMGATFFSGDPGSFVSMLAGLMLHMMMSVVFGIVFALIIQGRTSGVVPLAIGGMVFSVAEWAIAITAVLPSLDKALLPTFGSVGGIVAHLMFGAVLGVWLARTVAPGAERVAA